jgi:hypothetical protein
VGKWRYFGRGSFIGVIKLREIAPLATFLPQLGDLLC